jgi:acetyltransferase-like isoleucine patch superfamily enzyme
MFFNSWGIIGCHDRIESGDDVQFGPNVQIYDHDYREEGGIKAVKYRLEDIKIGNNVWICANTVILRGTELGDGCMVTPAV